MTEIDQDRINTLVDKAFKNTLGKHKYARPLKYSSPKSDQLVSPEELEIIGKYKAYEVGLSKPNIFVRTIKRIQKWVYLFRNRNSPRRREGYSAYVIGKKTSWWEDFLAKRAIKKNEKYRLERSKRVRTKRAKNRIVPSDHMSSKGEFRFRDPDKQTPPDLR